MEIIRICLLAITCVLLIGVVKSCKPEYGIYLAVAVCLVLAGAAVNFFSGIMSVIEKIQGYFPGEESYLVLLLKAVGATYACELCAGICKDAGYGGIAGQVEMLGKLYVLWTGMPVLFALLECIRELG